MPRAVEGEAAFVDNLALLVPGAGDELVVVPVRQLVVGHVGEKGYGLVPGLVVVGQVDTECITGCRSAVDEVEIILRQARSPLRSRVANDMIVPWCGRMIFERKKVVPLS